MGWLSNLFGGGSNKTTTTASSEPWKVAQPFLKKGLNQAGKLFDADPTGQKNVFTGSTVIPWSSQTQNAMKNVANTAYGNMGGRGTSGAFQDIINQGGYNDAQRGALGLNQAMMSGNGLNLAQEKALGLNQAMMSGNGLNSAQERALQGVQGLAANPFNSYQRNALQNTQRDANSSFDLNANPAFQQVLQQAQGAARDSVNMSAGAAGRYGGGVHQGNLASEVGDLTSRMVGNEYNNWQNRRDAANQNLFSMGQTGIGTQMAANTAGANIGQQGIANRMNAASNASAIGQQGIANRMGAANNVYGMGQQAIGNLGSAYQGLQNPMQDLMQVGAMKEDLATRQMNDRLRIFNEQNQAPWDQIARLNAVASGAGQMGGTTTQSQPGQNPFLSALGYGLTGAGALGGLFG